jgi:hypothetical protein
MATIDMKKGGTAAGLSWTPTAQPGVVSIRLRAADAVTAKGGALAASDIIEVLTIPAGTSYGKATINVITADTGSALTCNLGDTAAAATYIAAGDLTATGIVAEGTGAFDVTQIAAAATVLEVALVTVTSAGDDWEIDVLVEICDYTGNPRAKSAKDAG